MVGHKTIHINACSTAGSTLLSYLTCMGKEKRTLNHFRFLGRRYDSKLFLSSIDSLCFLETDMVFHVPSPWLLLEGQNVLSKVIWPDMWKFWPDIDWWLAVIISPDTYIHTYKHTYIQTICMYPFNLCEVLEPSNLPTHSPGLCETLIVYLNLIIQPISMYICTCRKSWKAGSCFLASKVCLADTRLAQYSV